MHIKCTTHKHTVSDCGFFEPNIGKMGNNVLARMRSFALIRTTNFNKYDAIRFMRATSISQLNLHVAVTLTEQELMFN